MSSLTPKADIPESLPPTTWRSLEERAGTAEFRRAVVDEFPGGATCWPPELDRRDFLRLMGASVALAGLTGCVRRSGAKIVPYVQPPENLIPGIPQFYATTISVQGYGRGIVVETHEGRPTKIEGNPDHPESAGKSDAITQASILSLYDPDRSKVPVHLGVPSTWQAFEAQLRQVRARAVQGEGFALLTEPTTSPTLVRELHRFKAVLPLARWYQHTPLADYGNVGRQPDYDFEAAEVILSLGSDCLYRHPAALRYSRSFARRRRIEAGQVRANRFYAVESVPTVTGAQADFRLPASTARTQLLLNRLVALLEHTPLDQADRFSAAEGQFLVALAADLQEHAPAVLCIAGPEQPDEIREWAEALNARFGAEGKTVRYVPSVRSDRDPACAGQLPELASAIGRSEINALIILGSNPGYTAPADLPFADLLRQVQWTVHMSSHLDETGGLCTWHLPECHYLEGWSDLTGYDGTVSLAQPLIEPLYAGRGLAEVIRLAAGGDPLSGYELVRATWQAARPSEDFEGRWNRWLMTGVVESAAFSAVILPRVAPIKFPRFSETGDLPTLSLMLYPDANLEDGRWANNAWLQELPRPMTHLVWDNAALLSPGLAAKLSVRQGDLLELTLGTRRMNAPVWLMPGQALDCVAVSLGQGRTAAGAVGNGRGFNAYGLRTTRALWGETGLGVRKQGTTYPLVATQHHFAMEGRDLVRVVTPDAPAVAPPAPKTSLYEPWKLDQYAWGMSIDLSTCLGCNACIAACQAENNIPVVGKDQVSRGREMHWIRLDLYFEGEADSPRLLHQPVPCMQCENAPCELVCPVGATVHSSEGLNEMVYNRCVGTRYCSNNCPYKVRRFNFLDYRSPTDSALNLQKNPDVTVRERGVMEKCTYCVQRINAARITAEKGNRRIRDGEIQTACQQACPVDAIVFGDIKDPLSRVSGRKAEPTSYSLLEELNTRPRTTYLAKVRQKERRPAQ